MQVRSWMAAVVIAAGATVSPVAQVQAQQAESVSSRGQQAEAANARPAAGDASTVELNLMIAGLGKDGCEVEIKPGNRSCRFQAQKQNVVASGKTTFRFRDVEVRGADRNCAFAITIRESGQSARTIYRAFRVAPRTTQPAGKAQSFTCYMNSPSKLAGLEQTDRTRQ